MGLIEHPLVGAIATGDARAVASSGDSRTLLETLNEASGSRHTLALNSSKFDAVADVLGIGYVKVCYFHSFSSWRMDCIGTSIATQDAKVWNIIIQKTGSMTIRHYGASDLKLSAGDWSVLPPFDYLSVNGDGPASFVSLVVPERELTNVGRILRKLSFRRIDTEGSAAHLFLNFVDSILEEASGLGPSSRLSFSLVMIQMLRSVALDLAGPKSAQSPREMLYRRACDIIHAELRNESLTVQHLANKLGCSTRYLHYIFSQCDEAGKTPASYIRECRLLRCKAELVVSGSGSDARTIAEIAHNWGFHDPAHFSQLFRRAFGMPPAAFRASRLVPASEPLN